MRARWPVAGLALFVLIVVVSLAVAKWWPHAERTVMGAPAPGCRTCAGGSAQSMLAAAGLLDDVPYQIEWSTFTSGPPLLEAISAGGVDIGRVGNTPSIFAAAAKAKLAVVSSSQGSVKGDAILVPADSPLRAVRDLRGKTIAVAKGSSAHGQVLLTLRKAGLGRLGPSTAQAKLEASARVLADGSGTANGYTF